MKKTLANTAGATALVAGLLLGGCSLIPEEPFVPAPVPASWPQGPAYQPVAAGSATPAPAPDAPTDPAAEEAAVFRSPQMQRLIALALTNNRDLRVAALNIEAARAAYRTQGAARLPTVTAGGGSTLRRSPAGVNSSVTTTTSTHNADVGVTAFELDLFGRVKSLEQQALEQYLATGEAQLSTRISLVAEVADAYLSLLADRKLLTLTEETLASQERTLALVQRRLDQGIGVQLDIAQARTAVETARANRARYVRQVAQDVNALVLLLGTPVEPDSLEGRDLEDPSLIADVPVGLSSSVLLRRPDIRQSEHQLKAANANIGAARAAFYPSISLTGTLGAASGELTSLFAAGAGAWSFLPSISLPIFDNGKNEAALASAVANRDIAVAQYEKAIQTAFREVSDALAARGTYGGQLQAQRALVNATRDAYRLSQARYDRGIDNFLTVLDAQRSLYSAEQDLIGVELSKSEQPGRPLQGAGRNPGNADAVTRAARQRAGRSPPRRSWARWRRNTRARVRASSISGTMASKVRNAARGIVVA